ncbi:GNAT family N-acetyltransferase [Draconibacterium sp. IB214405]|uniref:GNAT family N-acetyltransferase n=1 Tax=Draconibacterium sp. IB214405 TaxID=3097352 RepID=UPI002A0C5EFD|nr:GNAT family N-acetyltransferase [Draconibacterium sp. IB214405]MDX8338561.1 GNAT family N-acetyltransferase [Draconibacterium sp. IB214405]
MIQIREAQIKDAGIILECIKGLAVHVDQLEMVTATEQDIRDSVFAPDTHVKVFVAENEEQKVCGFTLLFKSFSTFKAVANYHIEDLFVFPEYRKLGIGSLLMEHIKTFAQNKGAKVVDWYVNNRNLSAMDFYDRIGAKKLDYKSIYYFDV